MMCSLECVFLQLCLQFLTIEFYLNNCSAACVLLSANMVHFLRGECDLTGPCVCLVRRVREVTKILVHIFIFVCSIISVPFY